MNHLRRILIAVAVAGGLTLIYASTRQPEAEAASNCTVPKSWGSLRAISDKGAGAPVLFAFEDEAGMVRVTVSGCKPGYVLHQIDRQ